MIQHAKRKSDEALQKVDDAIKQLLKKQYKINFNSVAQKANVSKSFLYKNNELRTRIEVLRRQQEGLSSPKQVKRNMTDASKDVIISSLKKRLKEKESENEQLKKQIQVLLKQVYTET